MKYIILIWAVLSFLAFSFTNEIYFLIAGFVFQIISFGFFSWSDKDKKFGEDYEKFIKGKSLD